MIKKILFLFFVVFAATAYSQDVTITGTVTDANSEPLVGVNVLVKGTTTGAITDIDGNFSVSGKKGSTLVFSYIGMLTQEVVYKGTALRVVMKDDSKALEEVVVIGYQTVKKSDLTGAVAVVDTKEMKKSAAGTLVSQMQGLATPGSVIIPSITHNGELLLKEPTPRISIEASSPALPLLRTLIPVAKPCRCRIHPDSEGRFCCCHLRFACCQWCDYRYYQEGYERSHEGECKRKGNIGMEPEI